MPKLKKLSSEAVWGLSLAALVFSMCYAAVALTVFQYRHPTMTDPDIISNLPAVLMFQTVDEDEEAE